MRGIKTTPLAITHVCCETRAGAYLPDITAVAIKIAQEFNVPVHFEFNGRSCKAFPHDLPGELAESILNKTKGGRDSLAKRMEV